MPERENPATVFMARNLAERITGIAWRDLSTDRRAAWLAYISDLVIAMYAAGFSIPQPDDPNAVWADLKAATQ